MSQTPEQSIEELRKRFDGLKDKRTRAEANLANSETTLKRLRKQAKEGFGTDDPDKLERILEKTRAENEEKRANYQQHLDEIDGKLKALEEDAPSP